MHSDNTPAVTPPSLLEQVMRANSEKLEREQTEVDPRKTQTNPNEGLDPSRRTFAASRPPGMALGRLAPRSPGVLSPGPSNSGQGRDRSGNPVREPNIADLRDTLPRGDE